MTEDDSPFGIDPRASQRIFFGMLALVAGAGLAYSWFRPRPGPPPAAIAHDPLLIEGRAAYLDRCVSCHGSRGHGDGPIARGLSGPPPRDFSGAWRHGDRPEQVLRVVAKGAEGTAMPGWAGTLTPRQVRAVAAYTYFLGGRPVPEALRRDGGGEGGSSNAGGRPAPSH